MTFMMEATDTSTLYSSVSVAAAALLAIMSGFIISKVVGSASEIDSLQGRIAELETQSSRLQREMDNRRHRITEISREMFVEVASEVYSVSDDLESIVDEARWDLSAHDPGVDDWLSTLQLTAELLGQRIQSCFEGAEINPGEETIRGRVGVLSPLEEELFNSIWRRELARRREIQGFGKEPSSAQTGPKPRLIPGLGVELLIAQEKISEGLRQETYRLGQAVRRSAYLSARQTEFDAISELAAKLGEVLPTLETVSLQLARIRGAANQKGPLLFLLGLLLIGVIYPLVLLAVHPVPSGGVYRFSSIAALLLVFLGEGRYLWRALSNPVE